MVLYTILKYLMTYTHQCLMETLENSLRLITSFPRSIERRTVHFIDLFHL